MSNQRIKGQEVQLLFVVNNVVQQTITDVHTADFAVEMDILEEEYLGETTKRYDEIFKGISGKVGAHLENEGVFTFVAQIVDRAKRRTPGVQVNVKVTFAFPNGDRPRIILKNVFFSTIPFSTPSRSAYVDTTFDFKGSDYSVIG